MHSFQIFENFCVSNREFILFLLGGIYLESSSHCAYKQALLGIGGHLW